MAALAQPEVRKRVKVYELKSNDWFDRGTGFCTGQIVHDEARIHVQSEDEPDRTLLETRISKDDGYQKQQDTLIVWTEANVTDMALSFQEPEGCAAIWDFVREAQERLGGGIGAVDDGLSDELMDPAQAFSLPPPELGNLVEVENNMRMANSTAAGRDALAKFVVSAEYISKLCPLVEMAEDLESLEDLHRLCNIMKTLILLNDTAIIEQAVRDDLILGVVGALEYDPDFPSHKANHRQYLSDASRFKEVVKIEEPHIRRKIHTTYRLQYLKDVVLARILDDPTFSVLNSLIFFNQVDIVNHVQTNAMFLKELFSIFTPTHLDQEKRKDAVVFIQQCCAIAKGLQANARQQLYANFIGSGLFNVITFALKHFDSSVRVAGTDILMALIDHDTLMMRGQVFKAVNDHQKPLTDVLIELLLVEVDLGVKSQMADAIKILLDPAANMQSLEAINRSNSEFFAKSRSHGTPHSDSFASELYKDGARKLFKPIMDVLHRDDVAGLTLREVSLYAHLVDLLCFFVRQHGQRTKFLLIHDNLLVPVAKLLASPEKHLKLVCLKFFRTCIGLHDSFYNERIIGAGAFGGILDIVLDTMPRDNLLNSACLELFEFIKRENMKDLTLHLVDTYRDRLAAITYVETFRGVIEKYEKYKHPPVETMSFTSVETEAPNRVIIPGGQQWRQQGLKEQDTEEERYFNGVDYEEDETHLGIALTGPINGTALKKPLVDYPEDDDDDGTMDVLAQEVDFTDTVNAGDAEADPSLKPAEQLQPVVGESTDGQPAEAPPGEAQPVELTATEPQPMDTEPAPKPSETPPSPPESLSEKRKREDVDDEEDELAKLAEKGVKRRSSVSSLTSEVGGGGGGGEKAKAGAEGGAPPRNHGLRRRKSSMAAAKEAAPKKISISLAVQSGNAAGDGGG